MKERDTSGTEAAIRAAFEQAWTFATLPPPTPEECEAFTREMGDDWNDPAAWPDLDTFARGYRAAAERGERDIEAAATWLKWIGHRANETVSADDAFFARWLATNLRCLAAADDKMGPGDDCDSTGEGVAGDNNSESQPSAPACPRCGGSGERKAIGSYYDRVTCVPCGGTGRAPAPPALAQSEREPTATELACCAWHSGWMCSLPKGHEGDHVAQGAADEVCATWPAPPALDVDEAREIALAEIAALRDELGRTNEALAACQSEAAGQIAELRGRLAALRDAARFTLDALNSDNDPRFSVREAKRRLAAALEDTP